MDAVSRIESSLADAVLYAEAAGAPPRLAAAMRHAVFPKGGRIRPRLTLAVAASCGDDSPALSSAAGAAIELLHVVSEVVDHVTAIHPGARVEVASRTEAPGGIVVEIRTASTTRYDPSGRRGMAAALRGIGFSTSQIEGQALE